MTCIILGGDLPINVTWLLNGYPIESDLGITLGSMGKRTHILNIDSASENHAGNYTCFAQNYAGIAQHTSILIVNGLFIYSVDCYHLYLISLNFIFSFTPIIPISLDTENYI